MDVDIDSDIGRWILEFLLRQPIENRLLNSLIDILPLPNDNSSLKKMLLVRKIDFEISKDCVSENILDFLEKIDELDFQNGMEEHSVSIKAAYCAVAVACTVKFLVDNGIDGNFKYFEAVKRIWRGKVCKIEEEKAGLISEELLNWKDDIEAAVWEKDVCDKLQKRSEGMDAIGAVRAYVDEEKGKMGPSFLEFVAQTMRTDDTLRGLLCDAGNAKLGKTGEEGENLPSAADQELCHSNGDTEGHKEIVLSRRKHIAFKRARGTPSGMSRGAKIADTNNSVDEKCKKCDLPPTPEVEKVQEALKSSSLELQAVVKDPLPDALHLAETLFCLMKRENTSKEPVEESQVRANPPVAESSRATQANGDHLSSHCQEVQNNASKPSLMERNSTAHTFEWDDSIGGTPEVSPNGSRVQLPSPKRRLVSPLKKYDANKLMKRRKIKRWSIEEEDTLRSAVQKYGSGNWKLILNAYRDIFQERTEVDLKDKWRNMTRYTRL